MSFFRQYAMSTLKRLDSHTFNLCKKILAQAYLRPSLSVLIWLKLPAFYAGAAYSKALNIRILI